RMQGLLASATIIKARYRPAQPSVDHNREPRVGARPHTCTGGLTPCVDGRSRATAPRVTFVISIADQTPRGRIARRVELCFGAGGGHGILRRMKLVSASLRPVR